jgi:hypothetical protein
MTRSGHAGNSEADLVIENFVDALFEHTKLAQYLSRSKQMPKGPMPR